MGDDHHCPWATVRSPSSATKLATSIVLLQPSYWINCEADVRPAFVFGVEADQEINAKKVFDLFTGCTSLLGTSVLTTDNIFHATLARLQFNRQHSPPVTVSSMSPLTVDGLAA